MKTSNTGKRLGIRRLPLLLVTGLLLITGWSAQAADPVVEVSSTYINVHTGPGRGYPIYYIVEKGEAITLLKQRTDWVKIQTRRDRQGWVSVSDLAETRNANGDMPAVARASEDDYQSRRWELGFAHGDFDGADSLTASLGYRFTEHLTVELRAGQNTGEFSDSRIATLGLLHQPFPDWRVSPYVRLATGRIEILPSATLVEVVDREDNLFQAGVGAYVYLSRRFFLRLEMTNHQILTSRDTNEEVNEWQLGFNVFF